MNTRLSQATVFGGVTIGKDSGDLDSGDLNNPNNLINNNGAIGYDSRYQVRGGFTYRLPADGSSPAPSANRRGFRRR